MSSVPPQYLTSHKVKAVEYASTSLAVLSALMNFFIICSTIYIYRTPTARHNLKRTSFRLLLVAIVLGLGYDLTWIILYSTMRITRLSGYCVAGVYFMIGQLNTINNAITCIAVNLMFTLCFEVNPVKYYLERWYMGFSLLGLLVPIVPAALGWFAWNPKIQICWVRPASGFTLARVEFLSLHLWQLLCGLIATFSVILALASIVRQHRRSQQVLKSNPLQAGEPPGEPWWRPTQQDNLHRLQDHFGGIIWRIMLYPLALIITNGLIAFGSLYVSKHGVKDEGMYVLYVMCWLLFGGRGIIIACLCIFVDPCLRRGVQEAWSARHPNGDNTSLSRPYHPDDLPATSLIDLNTKSDIFYIDEPQVPPLAYILVPRRPTVLDLRNAVRYTSPIRSYEDFSAPSSRRGSLGRAFTRSFAGVKGRDLPDGLTDDVDIDLNRVVSK